MTNDKLWKSLTPEQQKAMDGASLAVIKYNNENRIKDETDLVAFFESKGLDVHSPDVAAFRKHALDAYLNGSESKNWPPNTIKELDSIPTAPACKVGS